jgi:hypothetical protein
LHGPNAQRDKTVTPNKIADRAGGPPLDVGEAATSADSVKRAAHGYAETREAAMAAFAKSWRRE